MEGQIKFSLRQENFLLTTSRKGNRVRLHLLNHILHSRISLLSSETPHVKDKNMNSRDILDIVRNDLSDFVLEAPQFDDITMLAMSYKELDD